MKKFLFTFSLVVAFSSTQAQSARDSLLATINTFFEGLKKADTALLRSSLSDNAVLQTVQEKGGKVSVRDEKISEFLGSIAGLPPGAADEKIEIGTVLVDAALASVWTPYKFYFKEKFSHCGVNSFQLVRINNLWKIQYIIDTRRTTGCL
ncbi:MAG: nuclear transport factor 2 family protein [Bacteroidota bacterium]